MTVTVSLHNTEDNFFDQVLVEDIENKDCFTYVDNDLNNCEMCIYDDGICFFKQAKDYLLELHLKDMGYCKISSEEGILKFDAKVVDFKCNSDILVMRYIVNDEERIIEIKYS